MPKKRETSASSGFREVAGELHELGVREEHEALTIARIDPASEIAEGDEAELWLDTSRVHYFDPESGENLVPVEDREPVGATSSSSSADGAPGSFAVVPDERVGRPLEHADGAVPLVERRALPAPVGGDLRVSG